MDSFRSRIVIIPEALKQDRTFYRCIIQENEKHNFTGGWRA